jgi:ATP-dependent DNA helicase RecG
MTESELESYIRENFPLENEKCEWKEFKSLKHNVSGKEGNDIISYLSSISNMNGGHLVIGVKDKELNIIGIQDLYDYNTESIKIKLIQNCTNLSSEGLSISEFITSDSNKVVWIINIPKHPFRLPVYAHKKAWQRIGDSLVELTNARRDAILQEVKPIEDWSAVIIENATIDDLDISAIEKAKVEFAKRNPKYSNDILKWDNAKFLNKSKLTIKGKITRTCMILLGKEEEEHFLNSTVKIRWNLKTVDNQDKDFEIFSIPFILAIDEVYKKIRNLKYRYLRNNTLFPDEVLRYDPFNIREPLNNAIAHQDYSKGARINVVEVEDDHLIFSNYGAFLPKSVENVVLSDSPEEIYRNPFLVEAMKNLDMIETQGGGIRKIFNNQRTRFFPLPIYKLDNEKVSVTIYGKVLNQEFANILIKNPNLSLDDIILLDKAQKKLHLSKNEIKYLRAKGFLEGRKPNYFLSAEVIIPTNDESLKSQYIANRSFDDEHFKKMIVEYISKFKQAKRSNIDNLIIPKLSDILNDKQKKYKVGNLLSSLRNEGKIQCSSYAVWELVIDDDNS